MDWPAVIDRLVKSDRAAFLEVSRLISGFLSSWRAFDFRDDWEDVIQEVVISVVQAVRNQNLNQPQAVVGFIRGATRNKFVDRIRRRQREAPDIDPVLVQDEQAHWPPMGENDSRHQEIWDAVRNLPDQQQQVVVRVYAEGRTYDEASEVTGIPLGSLKRHLRLALEALRLEILAEGANR